MPFFPGIVFIVHNTEKYCKSYSNLIEKIPRFLRKVYNFVTLSGIFWQKYTDIFKKIPRAGKSHGSGAEIRCGRRRSYARLRQPLWQPRPPRCDRARWE